MRYRCDACRETFKGNPSEYKSLCPSCEEKHEEIRNRMVAGKWRVSNDIRRELFAALIREHTEYDVWEVERVGDLYVYDPREIDLEAGGKIQV